MKYPIGIQSFDQIREDGYVYVDKTGLIYNLVTQGKTYFLSRPRRFGKSLLVSTLACYFQGRKDLFAGLEIDGLEKDWYEYPIFRSIKRSISFVNHTLAGFLHIHWLMARGLSSSIMTMKWK
jgi:O-acetylhomoserine/O-acetylserine sulfhydrylase-like pyridoxal-dependent enzyme